MNDTAVLRLAKDITWENKVVEAGDEPTSALKIRSAYIASSIEAAIDERFDARIEARMRELAPELFKDAPVPPESIMGEPGDIFAGVSTNAVSSPYTVTAIRDSGMRVMIGADGYTYGASLGMLRDPALFRLVKRGAAAVAPERGIVGDRFACVGGEHDGDTFEVEVIHPSGRRGLVGPGCVWSAQLRNLLDRTLWHFVSSAAERAAVPAEMAVIADEPGDLDGPAGDVTAGRLTVAAEMLRETDAAVRDLIRVWHAYNHDKSVYTTHADFNATVEALAKCAGLPVPWLRPT